VTKELNFTSQKGYLAVTLLVFVVVSVVIATAAIGMSIANLQAVSAYEQSAEALLVAQSGIENALIRLLRDPSYTGETLTVGTGTATITVTGTNPQTVISKGVLGTKQRTLRAIVDRTNGIVSVTSYSETF
jgi:hypothetical protein